MKKICSILLSMIMVLSLLPIGVFAAEETYIDVINELVEKYGDYEVDNNQIATGAIYGEWIDFDNNGIEEMLVICKEKTNEYSDIWANVFIYGTENGSIIKLLDMPLCGCLGQTDIGYEIQIGEKEGKTYIVFNTQKNIVDYGDSEKIVIFTMSDNKPVTHIYYGEVLPWWDDFSFNYTKYVVDNKEVSGKYYEDTLAEYQNNTRRQLLFQGEDFEGYDFCSKDKINEFIKQAESKGVKNSGETNEITGTLSERFIVDGVGNDVQCLIMILDTPQNFCVTDTEGETFVVENVEEVQIGVKNYNESMDGSKVKIKSYDEIFEGHTFYHIRPIVINGAELEVVKDNVMVTLNGKKIDFDQQPIIVDNRTLVPLRAIFESLGATVDWNGTTQTVTSTKDDTTISMTIGQKEMYKNGEVKKLDVAAQIVNNRTLVPVRAIAESFNCDVQWDDANKIVLITTKE